MPPKALSRPVYSPLGVLNITLRTAAFSVMEAMFHSGSATHLGVAIGVAQRWLENSECKVLAVKATRNMPDAISRPYLQGIGSASVYAVSRRPASDSVQKMLIEGFLARALPAVEPQCAFSALSVTTPWDTLVPVPLLKEYLTGWDIGELYSDLQSCGLDGAALGYARTLYGVASAVLMNPVRAPAFQQRVAGFMSETLTDLLKEPVSWPLGPTQTPAQVAEIRRKLMELAVQSMRPATEESQTPFHKATETQFLREVEDFLSLLKSICSHTERSIFAAITRDDLWVVCKVVVGNYFKSMYERAVILTRKEYQNRHKPAAGPPAQPDRPNGPPQRSSAAATAGQEAVLQAMRLAAQVAMDSTVVPPDGELAACVREMMEAEIRAMTERLADFGALVLAAAAEAPLESSSCTETLRGLMTCPGLRFNAATSEDDYKTVWGLVQKRAQEVVESEAAMAGMIGAIRDWQGTPECWDANRAFLDGRTLSTTFDGRKLVRRGTGGFRGHFAEEGEQRARAAEVEMRLPEDLARELPSRKRPPQDREIFVADSYSAGLALRDADVFHSHMGDSIFLPLRVQTYGAVAILCADEHPEVRLRAFHLAYSLLRNYVDIYFFPDERNPFYAEGKNPRLAFGNMYRSSKASAGPRGEVSDAVLLLHVQDALSLSWENTLATGLLRELLLLAASMILDKAVPMDLSVDMLGYLPGLYFSGRRQAPGAADASRPDDPRTRVYLAALAGNADADAYFKALSIYDPYLSFLFLPDTYATLCKQVLYLRGELFSYSAADCHTARRDEMVLPRSQIAVLSNILPFMQIFAGPGDALAAENLRRDLRGGLHARPRRGEYGQERPDPGAACMPVMARHFDAQLVLLEERVSWLLDLYDAVFQGRLLLDTPPGSQQAFPDRVQAGCVTGAFKLGCRPFAAEFLFAPGCSHQVLRAMYSLSRGADALIPEPDAEALLNVSIGARLVRAARARGAEGPDCPAPRGFSEPAGQGPDARVLYLSNIDALSAQSYPRQAFLLAYLCTHSQYVALRGAERRPEGSPGGTGADLERRVFSACRGLMESPYWRKTGLPSGEQIMEALGQLGAPQGA